MAQAQGLNACVSKVELGISCTNLVDKDVTSKSDPLCVLLVQDSKSKQWHEIARTERIKNSLNPSFSKKLQIDYYFEEVQNLRIGIYDIDNATIDLSDDDFLGQVECTLGQIVSSKKYKSGLFYKGKKPAGKGQIIVDAEEITDNRIVCMSFKALKLDKKDFLGKSDPFLELWRKNTDGSWQLAHRTEVVKNNLNPTWKPFSVPVQSLCGGDVERQIKFICNDWDGDGSHDLIGEFFSTLKELQEARSQQKQFQCINPKKKAKKSSYHHSGTITLVNCKVEVNYSFLDFIFGGLQLNFTVGIDFTGSNGDPRSPDSLHFMNPTRPNEYLQALIAVGNVVQDYDSDKLFPALGFGAKLRTNEVSHEFALNFQPQNPYCAGINGIVEAYKQAISQVKLWGPTNISPIINHVARFAAQAQANESSPKSYFVLLILTDGVITDMNETRTAIVNASQLPMSIIIVGVGSADFSAMEMLDGDDGVLRSPTGQPVARDIVQFVPYRKYKKASSIALAKAVLAEVPTQVTKYYKSRNMVPGNFTQAAN